MSRLLVFLGFILFVIGHIGFWCMVFNQVHATSCPRSARRGTEVLTAINVLLLGLVGLYLVLVYPNLLDLRNVPELYSTTGDGAGLLALIFVTYWHLCCLAAVFFIVRWFYWKYADAKPDFWTEHSWSDLDLDDDDPDLLHGLPTQLAYAMVPGNQLLALRIEEKTFTFADLPEALDGLKLVHLSDLHFTGRVGRGYFEELVRLTNEDQPDVICITGDLLDKAKCLDWIETTYGQLKAKFGCFYILGNHDRRIKDENQLRNQLAENGLINTNGQWISQTIDRNGHQATLWMAGNELPWFPGAESVASKESLEHDPQNSFFLGLCHSPDQWKWARDIGSQLMLAGHTHGGQVRLPVIGPVIAPSRYGVRYASGVFQMGSMAMQVSRGISGADPLRWNCPPELCRITLKRK